MARLTDPSLKIMDSNMQSRQIAYMSRFAIARCQNDSTFLVKHQVLPHHVAYIEEQYLSFCEEHCGVMAYSIPTSFEVIQAYWWGPWTFRQSWVGFRIYITTWVLADMNVTFCRSESTLPCPENSGTSIVEGLRRRCPEESDAGFGYPTGHLGINQHTC